MNFNWVEIVGACTGIAYLFLEIKQNMWLWPVGLLNAIFYAIIFYLGGLYAIMSLQLYYIVMMIYGWWNWNHMKDPKGGDEQSVQPKLTLTLSLFLLVVAGIIWVAYYFVLVRFTDSQVPIWDAMTTSLSIVGTWMLAKKYIEQWYVWIFVNIFSVGLYFSQGLQITAILYAFYAIMAVVGYYNWKKQSI